MTTYSTHQQSATHKPINSFIIPHIVPDPSMESYKGMARKYSTHGITPEQIRKEVTTTYEVRPLHARPCFPKQAQHLPLKSKNQNEQGFVYIHRYNSFIDISKMTHHDHSRRTESSNEEDARNSALIPVQTRSHDDVDAALTLANCLNVPIGTGK